MARNSLPAEMSIGVPIKVLHEAEGHIVTCETNTGEVYRGKLIEAEDNMNCQVWWGQASFAFMRYGCHRSSPLAEGILIHFKVLQFVTYRDGRVAQLEQVYIRGSKIRFLILPDMLKNAPMLKSMKNKNQGSGAGRGKAAILKAQGPKEKPLCWVNISLWEDQSSEILDSQKDCLQRLTFAVDSYLKELYLDSNVLPSGTEQKFPSVGHRGPAENSPLFYIFPFDALNILARPEEGFRQKQ
ncbi:hypothetical protein EI555_003934 [Monodon monoceros]|uniref:Small nuclear ribonucleoprotein Sm D3 n=1 Tax=Monodon monoceros TaxID=40151 RepID=A0A4U1EVX6_MONMO|nr:hypothetical protein EI555_003934 [Monodon monoceros]